MAANLKIAYVFLEKPASESKPGSAGWYNSAAFEQAAHAEGLYAKSVNGDAFSHEMRAKVIDIIKADLGQVDMVVYSLASPVRKLPDSGELVRSALKPIGTPYQSTAIDTSKDVIIHAEVEPATAEEIANTVTVMGGEDWELWMDALQAAGVLATVKRDALQAKGGTLSAEQEEAIKRPILEQFAHQSHPYYSSARLWDDGIIAPEDTRAVVALSLAASLQQPIPETRFGVFRM